MANFTFTQTPVDPDPEVGATAQEEVAYFVANPGAVVKFVNRVFDSVAAALVSWTTDDAPDPTGTSYPGPGTFGVDTSDYCVSGIYSA